MFRNKEKKESKFEVLKNKVLEGEVNQDDRGIEIAEEKEVEGDLVKEEKIEKEKVVKEEMPREKGVNEVSVRRMPERRVRRRATGELVPTDMRRRDRELRVSSDWGSRNEWGTGTDDASTKEDIKKMQRAFQEELRELRSQFKDELQTIRRKEKVFPSEEDIGKREERLAEAMKMIEEVQAKSTDHDLFGVYEEFEDAINQGKGKKALDIALNLIPRLMDLEEAYHRFKLNSLLLHETLRDNYFDALRIQERLNEEFENLLEKVEIKLKKVSTKIANETYTQVYEKLEEVTTEQVNEKIEKLLEEKVMPVLRGSVEKMVMEVFKKNVGDVGIGNVEKEKGKGSVIEKKRFGEELDDEDEEEEVVGGLR